MQTPTQHSSYIELLPVTPQCLRFIQSSYTLSGQTQPENRPIPLSIYKPARKKQLLQLLQNCQARTIWYVPSQEDAQQGIEPERIGFIIWHEDVIDYIYIKEDFRRQKVATIALKSINYDLDRPEIKISHYNHYTFRSFPKGIKHRLTKITYP